MPNPYDTIIIGAGIAGATIAHTLSAKKQKVLVLDKSGIAKGGSGAAGAFVSPKIGKASSLHALTNEAFEVAKSFYTLCTPNHFHQTSVIRIPKDEEDAKKFPMYEKDHSNTYEHCSKETLHTMGVQSDFDAFNFPEAGVCDAVEICELLLGGIDTALYEVKEIKKHKGLWKVGEFLAKNIVLATGYESDLVDMDYMHIKGVWGTRGDFSTSLSLDISMHQSMSIGANINGIVKLGATHEREVKVPKECEDEKSIDLKKMASALVDTSDFKLLQSYCGMRAGSKDYAPLVGKVIDVASMLKNNPRITKGGTPELSYIDNIYVFNGLGGRGFVFAPMLAKMLAEHMVEGKEVDKRVNPDRLFYKWCRKL